jgi:hypothetical protein
VGRSVAFGFMPIGSRIKTGATVQEEEIAHRVRQCDTRWVKEKRQAPRTRSWQVRCSVVLVAAFMIVIAGCSTSTKPTTSITSSTQKRAPAPVVTAIAPSSGPTAGGTTVTITGSGFTGVTKVAFGKVAVKNFNVLSDTKITAASPAQAASMQTVFVTSAGGTSAPILSIATFFYDAPVPTVTAISPTSGPIAGGTTVTITGSGFIGAGQVTFGPDAAAGFTVVSDTEITAVSPPQSPGARDVLVTTAGGTNMAATPVDQFAYEGPVPTVTAISPTSGPIAGGTTVTITGSGFIGASQVTFGPDAAAGFTVVSDTEITAVSPGQAASTRNITVTTAGEASAPVAADAFTYKP